MCKKEKSQKKEEKEKKEKIRKRKEPIVLLKAKRFVMFAGKADDRITSDILSQKLGAVK